MTESKYGHLFVTDPRNADEDYADANGEDTSLPNVGMGLALMDQRAFPGSKIFTTSAFITESSDKTFWVPAHKHDFDEILLWRGLDPENPKDLGAELFMTIEGEEHIVTTTGGVYIPAGTDHCPLGWNWIKRPFNFQVIFLEGQYQTDEHERKRAAEALANAAAGQ